MATAYNPKTENSKHHIHNILVHKYVTLFIICNPKKENMKYHIDDMSINV